MNFFKTALSIITITQISVMSFAQQYDVIISGGRVIDPESKLDAVRNVGIKDGKVAIITAKAITGKTQYDAKGLVVAPGFIDLHSHGQNVVADRFQAFDGVTTALELESGILPISDWYAMQSKIPRLLNYGASAAWTFARIAELEGIPYKADLVWFQKAFSLNKWVNDPATPEQVEKIAKHLEQGIKEGSIGIGFNAGYAPGGGYKELMAMHALAAKYKVPTFTHISGDYPNDPKSAAENVGDIISISAAVGSQDHICHINSSSLRDIGTTRPMIIAAQKKGLPITTEAYTYGASSTTIGASLFNEEGMEKKHIDYGDIMFNGTPLNEKTFTDLRKNEPGSVIVFNYLKMPKEEPVLDESVLFPGGAIASDAMPWVDTKTGGPVDDNQWPVASTAFSHPRSAGTYTRLLAHWVRDRKALSLMEAIEKASLVPARILEKSVPQMKNKGRIKVGADADIIVFNPNTVQDKADFNNPRQPSVGMQYVLVNGVAVIKDGEIDRNAKSGKPVRRAIIK